MRQVPSTRLPSREELVEFIRERSGKVGVREIARAFGAKNADRDIRIVPMSINGRAGALLYMDGEIDHSLSMAIDGDKIAALYIVRNPDKLRHVQHETPAHHLI